MEQMSDVMVMRCSGWTFAVDGRSLAITRRGTPWRRRRVEHLPLGRLRACYPRKSESHDIDSLGFCLVYDTDAVLIGIDRQYYEGDAHWFANYLSEAICERLRRVFNHTIGLGPHPEAELLRVVRPALQLQPPDCPVRPGPSTCRPTTTARWTPPHRTSRTGGPSPNTSAPATSPWTTRAGRKSSRIYGEAGR